MMMNVLVFSEKFTESYDLDDPFENALWWPDVE